MTDGLPLGMRGPSRGPRGLCKEDGSGNLSNNTTGRIKPGGPPSCEVRRLTAEEPPRPLVAAAREDDTWELEVTRRTGASTAGEEAAPEIGGEATLFPLSAAESSGAIPEELGKVDEVPSFVEDI